MLISFKSYLSVTLAKAVAFLLPRLGLGAASVLPGAIALRLHPSLLTELFRQVSSGLILVCGTNGKTTTALLLRSMLELQGYRVVHNDTGANLVNGLTTALLRRTNDRGQLSTDYAILEVDENILPLILPHCQPRIILALNLFRDQLDRYGEVDSISKRWREAMNQMNSKATVVLNGDDPTLAYLGEQLRQKVLFFGLTEPQLYLDHLPYATDSTYCPRCGSELIYQGVYLSHLGDFSCASCSFTKPELAVKSEDWGQILMGVYNKYNTMAAVVVAEELGLETKARKLAISNFQAAFGRAEELIFQGKKVKILLSKNPVGMNETLRAVRAESQGKSPTTLMVLNDRTPDGTDISWIWDVDTEQLTQLGGTIVVSGDRVYDLALRITYTHPPSENLIIQENLNQGIKTALEATPATETLYILPTYSAMLEVRQILTGKKIL